VVEVHVTGGEIDGVLHLDSLPFVGSICCSRRRDGSDPSDEDELYIADLHGTTQNVAEDRGSKSQPTEYAPFSRGSHYSGKNGESIAEAHAELDGAPHHIYSF